MGSSTGNWEARGAAKKAAILASIPAEWRLSPDQLDLAAGVRDITGPFTRQFLSDDEAAITSLDSVPIADAIKSGQLSAVQVTKAFCKAAAIAHQIVCCGIVR